MYKLTIYSVMFFVLFLTLSTYAAEKECSYVIRVKSNRENINSIDLPNGSFIARGKHTGDGDYNKAWARKHAAMTAKNCLDKAISNSTRPNACKPKGNLESGQGDIKNYNIGNLKSVAFNVICSNARQLNKEGILEGIEIYAYKSSGNDSCQIGEPNDSDYYTVAKGLSAECKDGLSVREVTTGKNYYTGWYFESAPQIKKRVKNWCKEKFLKNNYKIGHFEIQKDSGKIRALFDCL